MLRFVFPAALVTALTCVDGSAVRAADPRPEALTFGSGQMARAPAKGLLVMADRKTETRDAGLSEKPVNIDERATEFASQTSARSDPLMNPDMYVRRAKERTPVPDAAKLAGTSSSGSGNEKKGNESNVVVKKVSTETPSPDGGKESTRAPKKSEGSALDADLEEIARLAHTEVPVAPPAPVKESKRPAPKPVITARPLPSPVSVLPAEW